MSNIHKIEAKSAIKTARKYAVATHGRKIDPIELAVEAIETDICDRAGLKHDWAELDVAIAEHIKRTWIEIIRQALKESK